jgi:glycosyltransferase involved in cell wall biosynthesis
MPGTTDPNRYIVWIPGPVDWTISPAIPARLRAGGHQMYHEFAVAIAATGRRVELRGDVDLDELRALTNVVGVGPGLATEPVRPSRGDVVIVGEGTPDVRTYAQIALSGARLILLMLAPPGLLGWPFVEDWALQSPLEIPIDSVARPEQFRAIAAMGFELWTQMPQLLDRIEAAGLEGKCIGTGRPVPYPDPLPKRYDVVTLANNRWSELAKRVVAGLDPSVVHHEIPPSSNAEVLRAFGEARIVVHPLRVEGDSRIGTEARAMGAVPVVLGTNPFSVGLDAEGGAIPVPTLDEMPRAVMELLGDPDRLGELRERGMRTARAQVDWDTYVARVDAALSAPEADDPARGARAAMGAALIERENSIWAYHHQELGKLTAELEAERARAGDPQTGDPQTRDPQTRDPQTGDPQPGDRQATQAGPLGGRLSRARDRVRGRSRSAS